MPFVPPRCKLAVIRPLWAASGVLATSSVFLSAFCEDNEDNTNAATNSTRHGQSNAASELLRSNENPWRALSTTSTRLFFSSWARSSVTLCQEQHDEKYIDNNMNAKEPQDKLPLFTVEQVAQRNGDANGEIWVTLSNKVYNITEFVHKHKGGSFILNAAGGPIDDYWGYWAYHTHLQEPLMILKQYHIGYLRDKSDEDEESLQDKVRAFYAEDPVRDARQKVLTAQPFCSETPPDLQTALYTDNAVFYVRNHAPVPELTAEDYAIRFECCPVGSKTNATGSQVSLNDMKENFPLLEIAAAMECSGNRAVDLHKISPTAFAQTPFRDLDRGMMGNAVWSGYSLRAILLEQFPWLSQLSPEEVSKYHVEFEGADDYATSTPLTRILDPTANALLAVQMNNEDLPPDHGFPVRAFLPGIAGARNCKWLHTIRIIPHESQACFTQVYYKDPYGQAIQELPMQSFLTTKQQLEDGRWRVHGVAWGGGSGVGVSHVQVLTDGGAWVNVPLQNWQTGPTASREWSWIIFHTVLPSKSGVFTCRMVDKNGVVQPQALWYSLGYLSNTWHTL